MSIKQKAVSTAASAALLASLLATTVAGTASAAAVMSPTTGPIEGGTLVSITGGSGYTILTTIGFATSSGAPCTTSSGAVNTPIAATSVSPDGTSLTFLTPDCRGSGVGLYTVSTSNNTVGLPGFYYTNTPGPVTLTPAAGKNGTSVTLNAPGQVISATSLAATVNTVPVTNIIRVNSTTVTFTVPGASDGSTGACLNSAGSKAVSVTVTSAAGNVIGIPSFQCNPTTAYTMAPNSGTTSGGTIVQLSGDPQSFDLSCTIAGFAATVFPTSIAADGSKLTFVTPAAPTGTAAGTQVSVTVVATGAGSCTNGDAGKFTWTSATSGTGALQIAPTTGPTGGGTAVQVQNATGLTINSSVLLSGVQTAPPVVCTLIPTSIAADGKSLTFVMPSEASVTVAPLNAGCPSALTLTSHVIYVWTTTPGLTSQPVFSGSFTYGAVLVPIVTSVSPNTGSRAGGNTVTITGQNFVSGAAVAFGTTAATSVTFVSSTSLTAVVPTGVGVVSVTVKNPDGNSGQLASAYTYQETGYVCGAATALGSTKTGAFSTTTKVAANGTYITWKISCGSAASGQIISVLRATKNSAGVWSAFTAYTSRVADSGGNIYVWAKQSNAWWSMRGQIASVFSPARQGRWQ